MADRYLRKKLEEIIKTNPGIKVYSYTGKPQFISLVEHWQKKGLDFVTPEIPDRHNRWTQDFFGSKAGFRQAASVLGADFPKMPEGAICFSKTELLGWAKYLMAKGSGCVVKYNRGLAGAGLKIIKTGEELNLNEAYFQEYPVVVEEYITTDLNVCGGAPNIELRTINGKAEALYVCAMRVTPEGVFQGIEIGKGVVPEKLEKLLNFSGEKWGNYLTQLGYRGYFEIDFVAGTDGKVYPLEANLRRTGGTHVYETSQKLLGDNWHDKYIVATNMHSGVKLKSYLKIKKAAGHLFYDKSKQEGVIVTIANLLPLGIIGYMVVGEDKERTLALEKEFLSLC